MSRQPGLFDEPKRPGKFVSANYNERNLASARIILKEFPRYPSMHAWVRLTILRLGEDHDKRLFETASEACDCPQCQQNRGVQA